MEEFAGGVEGGGPCIADGNECPILRCTMPIAVCDAFNNQKRLAANSTHYAIVIAHFKTDMQTRIEWQDGVRFVGTSGSGHAVTIDGAPEHGGHNLGMRPMEMLLMGTAACSAFDVVLILRKSRQDVTGCVVDADAERAPDDPKVFTRIALTFTVTGRALDRRAVERAVALSKEKYCSATIMLAKTAVIESTIRVVEAGDAGA
jgi:putative redox protein